MEECRIMLSNNEFLYDGNVAYKKNNKDLLKETELKDLIYEKLFALKRHQQYEEYLNLFDLLTGGE